MAEHKVIGGKEKVQQYVRTNENGQTVTVKAHERSHSEAAAAAIAMPGRPPIAAQPGQFPGNRSIPDYWPEPQEVVTETPPPDTSPEAADQADALADILDRKGGASQAVVALRGLRATTGKKTKARAPRPPSSQADKVIAAAARLSTDDPNLIALALNPVRVRSYKRKSEKTGKIVDVKAYTQLRDLLSALGGPEMAAKKGITADLFAKSLPDAPAVFRGEDPKAPTPNAPNVPDAPAAPKAQAPDAPKVKTPDVPDVPDAPKVTDKPSAPDAPEAKAPEPKAKTPEPKATTPKARVGTPSSPQARRLARTSTARKREAAKEVRDREKVKIDAVKSGDAEAWTDISKGYVQVRDSGGIEESQYLRGGYQMHREKADDDGGFSIYVTDERDDDAVVATSYFGDPTGSGQYEETSDVHPDYHGDELSFEVRNWAESLTGSAIITDRPTYPAPNPPTNTSQPPQIRARKPIVDVYGRTGWGQVTGPTLEPGDKVFTSRSTGGYTAYAFQGQDGSIKGVLYTDASSTPKLGDEMDLGNFLWDAQQNYERENDLPAADYDDMHGLIYNDAGLNTQSVLDNFFDLAWTQPDIDLPEHIGGVIDALAKVPEGTRLRDSRGDVYAFDGSSWHNGRTYVPDMMVAGRLGMNDFGSPDEVISHATIPTEQVDVQPTTYGHSLARTPSGFDRGFPPITGDRSSDAGKNAEAAVLNALRFVPEPLARRFPDTFVSHERTRELAGPDKPGMVTNAFVANYVGTGQQELHLTDWTSDPKFASLSALNVMSGWSAPGGDNALHATVNHESGHIWENLLNSHGSYRNEDQFYGDLLNIFTEQYGYQPNHGLSYSAKAQYDRAVEDLTPQLRDDLSKYGTDNPREFIAEAWSEFIGADEPRPLATKVGQAIQAMTERLAADLDPNYKPTNLSKGKADAPVLAAKRDTPPKPDSFAGLTFQSGSTTNASGFLRRRVEVSDKGKVVGFVKWAGEDSNAHGISDVKGEISMIHVEPGYRRKGIATELLRRARAEDPSVHHSTNQTTDGSAWASVAKQAQQTDPEQVAPPISRDMFSNPDTPRTRGVTAQEFQAIALRGKTRLSDFAGQASDPVGLDRDWDNLKTDAYDSVQGEWGGMTIDTHSGLPVLGNEEAYALTVKPAGMPSESVPIGASREDFDAAMERARTRFAPFLRVGAGHLGVFRDEDSGRIDIDPVLVVDNLEDAESIGAYTHNIGGAYAFHDGNGYWPPHVIEGAPADDRPAEGLQGPGSVALPGDQGAPGGGGEGPGGSVDPGGAGDQARPPQVEDADHRAALAAVPEIPDLTDEDKAAIRNYQSSLYFDQINRLLRTGSLGYYDDDPGTIQPMIDNIDQVWDKIPPTTARLSAYRGSSGDWSKNLQPGDTFTDPGFSSLSVNPRVAERFTGMQWSADPERHDRAEKKGTLLKVNVPAGVPVLKESQGGIFEYENEAAITLKHGTQFRVTGREQNGDQSVLTVEVVPEEQRPDSVAEIQQAQEQQRREMIRSLLAQPEARSEAASLLAEQDAADTAAQTALQETTT